MPDFSQLLQEVHSKQNTEYVASLIHKDPTLLPAFMETYLTGDKLIMQRGAWVLRYIFDYDNALLSPWWEKMADTLKTPPHDAVVRNSLAIFAEIEVPEKIEGLLADLCFQFVQDNTNAVAIQVHAMEILSKLVRKYPDLAQELRIILEEGITFGTPGYRHRALKILKTLP